jgi:hypothetical protein
MEVSGQLHAPAASPPGKEPLVLIGQEAEFQASNSLSVLLTVFSLIFISAQTDYYVAI